MVCVVTVTAGEGSGPVDHLPVPGDRAERGDPAALGRAAAFGELILRHRLVTGLSQRELAHRAGLSERAVRDLERGATTRPRRHSVRVIAEALGLADAERAAFLAAVGPSPAISQPISGGPGGAVPVPLFTGPEAPQELIGRAGELWALLDLVMGGRYRIITVTGPGGVGKSRLVAELVAALRQRSSLPVVALDLSALTDPGLVADVIAEALTDGGPSRLPALERVAVQLKTRRVVAVLDCFERLVAAAPFVANLVRRCPGLTVLTTSQRPLRLAGERVFRLAPLPPEPAVELFVHRATATAPDFRRTDDNAAALAAICRRLDGLPLAIELAAAWMRLLTPAELVARLDRRLQLLTGGPRDRPPRHRSLRATLESSLEVVGEAAATLFAWLGAFAGGGRLADLEAVAAALGHEPGWLLAALTELVDTNIVRVAGERNGSRYTLPDTMRELAVERLAAGDGTAADDTAVRRAVARRILDLVLEWSTEPSGAAASVIDQDADNLRAALRYAADRGGVPVAPATAAALCHYYQVTGRLAEGQQALAAIAPARRIAWTYAGRLARVRGDLVAAEELGRRALASLDPGDDDVRTAAHLQLGGLAVERRDRASARLHLHAVLARGNRAGDAELMGRALNTLGVLAAEFGRLDDAERLWLAALAAQRRRAAGDRDTGSAAATAVMTGQILYNLAAVALESGRYELSVARAGEAQTVLQGRLDRLVASAAAVRALALLGLGDRSGAALAARSAVELLDEPGDDRRRTALVAIQCSVAFHAAEDLTAARAMLRQALPLFTANAVRHREEAAICLEAHANLLAPRNPTGAANLLGAAGRLRRDSPRPVSPAHAAVHASTSRACRAALGPRRYGRERDRGAQQTAAELADAL
jgi:predicted ATPase/transcriptional regulator with XRE-family HTH domain